MFDVNNATRLKAVHLIYYAIGIMAVWTLFTALSMAWNYREERYEALEAAKIEAQTAYEKDVLYRRWNANRGGVYAEITPSTQPNPYLDVPERDVVTPSNRKLTLINPAYMTRQAHELALQTTGVRGHITSLNCIRPANEPDPWERKALLAFQNGSKEQSDVMEMEGQPYMRLMRPLITESGCLKCHGAQGYKVGDIRGGISVSVPLSPFLAIHHARLKSFITLHSIIWLAGLAAVGIGGLVLKRQFTYRLHYEEESRHLAKLQGVLETAGAVCHELNQPMQAITGYAELLVMNTAKESPHHSHAEAIREQVERMSGITAKLMTITRYVSKEYPNGQIVDIDRASARTSDKAVC
jgi:C4-dicarboxylate-specific signal transduction histidine kinase